MPSQSSSPLGANPKSAMSIVDAFLQPQQGAATVTSDTFEQQRQQLMDKLNKLQAQPSYMQRSGLAVPPTTANY